MKDNDHDIRDNLKEELAILGITNSSPLTSQYVRSKKIQLMKIYHPDRLSRNAPKKEKKIYEERAKLINDAADKILSFLNELNYKPIKERKECIQVEEISGVTIQSMQEKIKRLWDKIKRTSYKMNEKTVILSNGISIKEILMFDVKYGPYNIAFTSIFGSFLMYLIVCWLVMFILQENTNITNFYILNEIFKYSIITHFIASVILIMPLSRFWLNRIFFNILIFIVKLGVFFYTSISDFFNCLSEIVSRDKKLSHSDCCIPSIFCQIYLFIPVLLAAIFKVIVIYPIYCIISALFGKIVIGKVEKKTIYYAAYSESYIEELLNKKIDEFTNTHRDHLSHIYSELKNA